MKLACTSGTCSQAIDSGELTQLEFLDFCANEFSCDSVVLDVRHFPRTDDDYLAQLKKMAADLGVTVAALADDDFLSGESEYMDRRIAQAVAVGAPLMLSRAAAETAMPWTRQLDRLNEATGIAKRANVTIGLRNAAGTFAGSVLDCKRVSKEADSAWLRYALDPNGMPDDIGPLEPKAVALYAPLAAGEEAAKALLERFGAFRGPLILDGAAAPAEMRNATRLWRIALARFELDRT